LGAQRRGENELTQQVANDADLRFWHAERTTKPSVTLVMYASNRSTI